MFMRVNQPNVSYQDPTAFVDHIDHRSKNLYVCASCSSCKGCWLERSANTFSQYPTDQNSLFIKLKFIQDEKKII